jgi:hypothetical protein
MPYRGAPVHAWPRARQRSGRASPIRAGITVGRRLGSTSSRRRFHSRAAWCYSAVLDVRPAAGSSCASHSCWGVDSGRGGGPGRVRSLDRGVSGSGTLSSRNGDRLGLTGGPVRHAPDHDQLPWCQPGHAGHGTRHRYPQRGPSRPSGRGPRRSHHLGAPCSLRPRGAGHRTHYGGDRRCERGQLLLRCGPHRMRPKSFRQGVGTGPRATVSAAAAPSRRVSSSLPSLVAGTCKPRLASFRSEPGLLPPGACVNKAAAGTARGYLFVTPKAPGAGATGPRS